MSKYILKSFLFRFHTNFVFRFQLIVSFVELIFFMFIELFNSKYSFLYFQVDFIENNSLLSSV